MSVVCGLNDVTLVDSMSVICGANDVGQFGNQFLFSYCSYWLVLGFYLADG